MNTPQMLKTNTVIVGASAAGLAVGACLKRQGIPFVLLERAEQVGTAWRNHYDRLHLHTTKGLSALPHLPFPRDVPRYPARQQVVTYLDQYAAHFDLQPHFGREVTAIRRISEGWECLTTGARYRAQNVVVATGYTRKPVRPCWPGQEAYQGQVLHSSEYRNGNPFQGQDVLVVGFGNSGGEIVIDLWEHGARPALSVRSPVNVVPRDLFGIPTQVIGILMSRLPLRLADWLSAPLVRLTIGDLTPYNLRKLPYGPNTQVVRDRRIPVLDVGTVTLIREGRVPVHPGIERFSAQGVVFTDGTEKQCDAVVLATGYRPALEEFLEEADAVTGRAGVPKVSGGKPALPGLYFCGFRISATGVLRETAIEAKQIARAVAG